ncbi:MAG: class I SAM-dependent methyltransferase, partial [Acetatifactor sp.]|nr:class I SAM-dependent methyltransferase [Acetatifactor sp.]
MKIAVFGTGSVGKTLLENTVKSAYELMAVVDNDPQKWGEQIGQTVISPPKKSALVELDKIIVAANEKRNEIRSQLAEMGIPTEKIVMCFDENGKNRIRDVAMEFFDFTEFPVKKQFTKEAPKNYEKTFHETYKSRERRCKEGFFEKYCRGEGIDIGWGGDLLTPNCSGWDIENGDAQYLDGIDDESFDFVYSSHCLEHIYDVRTALKNWFRIVKKGGYLIIAVPH